MSNSANGLNGAWSALVGKPAANDATVRPLPLLLVRPGKIPSPPPQPPQPMCKVYLFRPREQA